MEWAWLHGGWESREDITNSHPPKTSWLQTLSHAVDSKRETLHSVSYCSIIWHASQCAFLLLNSYLHDFNKCPWFPEGMI